MIAVEVTINGNLACVAGIGGDGVLNVSLSCISRSDCEDYFDLHVGGLDSRTDEHVRWRVPKLCVGSKVAVRFVEGATVDAPDGERIHGSVLPRYEYRETLYQCSRRLTSAERRELLRELIADLESQDNEGA